MSSFQWPNTAGTPLSIGSPANGLSLSGSVLSLALSSTSTTGALSSTDWNTFNGKQGALTFGNLTEATSSVLTISGGTGAVIGSGTTIQVKQASGSVSGFLSSTDWTTFNSKQASGNYITALTGDVTASGPGSAAATVALVGGSSAANVNTATVLVNTAQSGNKLLASPANGTSAAPAFRALVGADLPNPSSSTLGGIQSIAGVSHQWISSISTSGVPALTQPAFTDISGTATGAQLPNPSSSTLGGVQSAAGVSHQWINSISTSGTFSTGLHRHLWISCRRPNACTHG